MDPAFGDICPVLPALRMSVQSEMIDQSDNRKAMATEGIIMPQKSSLTVLWSLFREMLKD